MKTKPTITALEIVQWETELKDVEPEPTIGIPTYKPGSKIRRRSHGLRIHTDLGITGEYIGGSAMDYTAIAGFARVLLGTQCAGAGRDLQRPQAGNEAASAIRNRA